MKKLIIQIPCYNEEETLAIALKELPKAVPGFDVVEWLIIDDGSTDKTVEVALENGVDHIISLGHNRGLARGFMAGIEACLSLGADVIVNTDADNQYDATGIPDLVRPIVEQEAEFVIGERPISDTDHFSAVKKFLQKFGSWAVRVASKTAVPDAPSGFRAISRDAAMRLYVFSEYTYTLETIIQAGRSNIRVMSVPIRTNEDLRPSRLVKSIGSYVRRSMMTIIRIFLLYKPMRAFFLMGSVFWIMALLLGGRYLYELAIDADTQRIQSLVLTSILAMAGLICFAIAIVADLLAMQRRLLEEIRYRLLRSDLDNDRAPVFAAEMHTAPKSSVKLKSERT
ncbi:MAG: glycosyltransferase family 2 protein [Litorimonas sp.]